MIDNSYMRISSTDILSITILMSDTILDALKKLNKLSGDSLLLFVIDNDGKLSGTLTDGDVRRGLIDGHNLTDPVDAISHKSFYYIRQSDDIVIRMCELRKMGIKIVPVINDYNKIIDVINFNKVRSCLPIDAVVMAGGKGERLRPLTEKTPKPLLPVGDKSIIDYNIDRLVSYGIRHISVTVNYLKEQIINHFSIPSHGVAVEIVEEPQYLGTIGSVQFVKKFYNDTVLVMNSDLFTNINYEDFYLHYKNNNADMSIAAIPYSLSVPYGILDLEGRVVKGILEKPTYNYYANAGMYLIKKEMLKLIPENSFFNATDFLNLLVAQNKKVIRFPLNGTWIDIGNHQEYQKAKELVKHLD